MDNDNRFMWTASAARAGYKLLDPKEGGSDEHGEYQSTYWDIPGGAAASDPGQYLKYFWNMKRSDWDALLLPLCRAQSGGGNGVWDSQYTADDVFQDIRSQPWQA